MGTNVVNLDALIPREDFTVEDKAPPAKALETISIVHLEGPFFGPDLRKPDFQRETTQWTPSKIVDLLRAFVDGDLIPAVILWRSGHYLFVVDGAHRLSALLAWIHDDYGDRKKSLDYFGGVVTDEQRKIAERTRVMVKKEIGSYAEYFSARNNPSGAPPHLQRRLSNLAVSNIIAQWVPATDPKSAEASFFKINQAATPIDSTEKRILKARKSAIAIAARAITHAGTGHKYWSDFDKTKIEAIELAGKAIYKSLYDPPITGSPLTTLDVPVAGRGYNALPFVFDLVVEANGVSVPDTSTKQDVKDNLPEDKDGHATLTYLRAVARRLSRLTGDEPMSLGVHPVVYFYTRGGTFQPIALIATSRFLEDLANRDKLITFTKARAAFEDFLIEHKEAMSLLVHKFGTGTRSLPWYQQYYERILSGLSGSMTSEQIQRQFADDPNFSFLTVPSSGAIRLSGIDKKRVFNAGTKTASYFASALPGCVRCQLCGARVHRNAVNIDHIVKASDGGAADMSNAQVSHPYCNSIKG